MLNRLPATLRRPLAQAIAVLGATTALMSPAQALAVDWPGLAGTEAGRPVSALYPYGFVQFLAESTPFASDLSGLTGAALQPANGQPHANNVEAPVALSIRRARLGLRGVIPQSQDRISWHLSAEAGHNGVTRDRGVSLLDASVTLQAHEALQLRVGQFKLPVMDEVAQPIPMTLPTANVSQVGLLLLEQPIVAGQFAGQAYAFRDLGAQILGRQQRGAWEAAWALMLSQGRFGAADTDRQYDTSGRLQVAWLANPAKPHVGDRDEVSVFAWHLTGKRQASDGSGLTQRMRQGVGAHVHLGQLRSRVEVVRANGEILLGRNPATSAGKLAMSADGSALGVVAMAQWQLLPVWYWTLQYSHLDREPGDKLAARSLRDVVVSTEWRPAPRLRTHLEYTKRFVVTPQGVTPDAERIAEAVADLIQLQVSVLF